MLFSFLIIWFEVMNNPFFVGILGILNLDLRHILT